MLRNIVKSHAGKLVPSTKEPRLLQALTSVSCTRSSARSGLPQRDTANARRLGMTAMRSAFILALAAAGGPSLNLSILQRRIRRGLKLAEQVEKAIRHRFVQHVVIEIAQWPRDVLPEIRLASSAPLA